MEEKMIKKIKNNDGWRRIAVRPITGNKADILVALTRPDDDKLKLNELLDQAVDAVWEKAKARGLVSDDMLQLAVEPARDGGLLQGEPG
jgi:hypothetical protein